MQPGDISHENNKTDNNRHATHHPEEREKKRDIDSPAYRDSITSKPETFTAQLKKEGRNARCLLGLIHRKSFITLDVNTNLVYKKNSTGHL